MSELGVDPYMLGALYLVSVLRSGGLGAERASLGGKSPSVATSVAVVLEADGHGFVAGNLSAWCKPRRSTRRLPSSMP